MDIKIKSEFKNTIIAFGGRGKLPLGDRSDEDIARLALTALQSKDKGLLNLFDGDLPSIEELQKSFTEKAIKAGPVKKVPSNPPGDKVIQSPTSDAKREEHDKKQ